MLFKHLPGYQQEAIRRREAQQAELQARAKSEEAARRERELQEYKTLFGESEDEDMDVPLADVVERIRRKNNAAYNARKEEAIEAKKARFESRAAVVQKKNAASVKRGNAVVLEEPSESDEWVEKVAPEHSVPAQRTVKWIGEPGKQRLAVMERVTEESGGEDDYDADFINDKPIKRRPRRQAAAENPYIREAESSGESASMSMSMSASSASSSEFEPGKRRNTEQIWGDSAYKELPDVVDRKEGRFTTVPTADDVNFVTTKRKVETRPKMVLKKRGV